MAGTTLYLIRSNNLTFAKQEGVIDVFLSGSQTAYASVTGDAATNIVTIPSSTLANGMQVTFTTLTGGAGLTYGTGYFVVSANGSTCKLSLTEGGSEINFTTNIVASSVIVSNDQMRVWSSEFRDIFQTTGTVNYGGFNVGATASAPYSASGTYSGLGNLAAKILATGETQAQFNVTSSSDEVAHAALRQTLLNKTFWLFDRGASATPRYLPAEYQEGDIIATSPPNIP